MAAPTHTRDTEMHSDVTSSGTDDLRERENMHPNRVQSKNAKSLLRLLIGMRMARLLPVAAVALSVAASLSPETAHDQEYPWCVSRESYLYCFYKTREQSRGPAAAIGGCPLNPRLLFPNKPRDSYARTTSRSKAY